ncbi:hypothetical protein ACFLZB_04455, partial [Nanoarchaeota archaeon]
MDIQKIIKILHPLEIKILPILKTEDNFSSLVSQSSLSDIEVMRALQWLENKKILVLEKEEKQSIQLDKNGQLYLKEGLPEKRFLQAIKDQELTLDQIKEQTHLSPEEFNISLGILRKKAAIEIIKEKETKIKITSQGEKILQKESFEENFLKKDFPLDPSALSPEEKFAFDELKKRKEIVKLDEQKEIKIKITKLGQELLQQKIEDKELINRLTSSKVRGSKSNSAELNFPFNISTIDFSLFNFFNFRSTTFNFLTFS